jgi:branched-chain amino acid transport system ATP-binding protein
MLSVKDLNAWYGGSHVLHGGSLELKQGEVISLIGRNGAGKTTTLKSIMGVVRSKKGSIQLDGKEIGNLESNAIARLGISFVPEERAIFSSLTVRENLELPPVLRPGGWPMEKIYQTFPVLKTRGDHAGSKLSGGEQQILAIVRVLRAGPRILLLDEPSEGLAPVMVQLVGRILRQLKQEGMSIVLVEQNLRFALTVADRHYLIVDGKTVEMMTSEQVRAREKELLNYLSV